MSARVRNGLKYLMWLVILSFFYGFWGIVINFFTGLEDNAHQFVESMMVILGAPLILGLPAFVLGWRSGGKKESKASKPNEVSSSINSPSPSQAESDQVKQSFSDEYYYSVIAKEMELNRRVPALWIQALELAEGNPQKQVSEYIKLRFRSLKSEKEKQQNDSETLSLARDKPNVDRDQPTLNDVKPARHIDRPTLDINRPTLNINRSNPDRDRVGLLRDKAIKKINIDSFIELIKTDPPIEVLESYFEGLYTKDVTKFLNTCDALEQYPLHVSIKNSLVDVTQWLLEKGANPNATNYWGKTILDLAKESKNDDIIALFKVKD